MFILLSKTLHDINRKLTNNRITLCVMATINIDDTYYRFVFLRQYSTVMKVVYVLLLDVWYHATTTNRVISINTLRPRQNGRHVADDTFKGIFLKETVRISIKILLKFVPESPIDIIPALF